MNDTTEYQREYRRRRQFQVIFTCDEAKPALEKLARKQDRSMSYVAAQILEKELLK